MMNYVGFDTLNPRTPLSARWAEMSKQEQIIEKKKIEIQAKMDAQRRSSLAAKLKAKSDKPSPSAMSTTKPPPNVFSNDGSFLNRFKKIATSNVPASNVSTSRRTDDSPKSCDDYDRHKYNNDKNRDGHDKYRSNSSGQKYRDRSRSSSRERERRRDRNDRNSRNERNDRKNFRDSRSRRWDSGGRNRRQSTSPSTPVLEDMPQRKNSRFSNIVPVPNYPNQPSLNAPFADHNLVSVQNLANPIKVMLPVNTPQHMVLKPYSNESNMPVQSIHMPNTLLQRTPMNNFNMQQISNCVNPMPMPSFMHPPMQNMPLMNTSNNVNFVNNQPLGNANNFNNTVSSNMLPSNPPPFVISSVQDSNYAASFSNFNTSQISILPNIRPVGERGRFSSDRMFPNMSMSTLATIPPPMNIPLHTIPQPQPIDTESIPPPKPLMAISIPPPKPLEAVTIPPPKPMNLKAIPSPSPICLTQIPKPKELDLCSIPQPPISSVLSSDGPSWGMEAVAKQVAGSGHEWEEMLKAQSAQDNSLWFLRDNRSADYKMYQNLVMKFRTELKSRDSSDTDDKYDPLVQDNDYPKSPLKEEPYEPDFTMRDDDSDSDDEIIPKVEKKKENDGNKDMYKNFAPSVNFRLDCVKPETLEVMLPTSNDIQKKLDDASDEETVVKDEINVKKRKSRWGGTSNSEDTEIGIEVPSIAKVASLEGLVNSSVPVSQAMSAAKAQLTKITRQDPGLLQYAFSTYGNVNLSDQDWKKCEDHYKISLLYQEMLIKRQEIEKLAAKGKFKYEYDSDEDVDEEGGTWEHRLRQQEMEATQRWAGELTRQASGKHHIGDFLPPDELKRFMEKYSAVKGGKEPDLSDYKEFKLKEDNIGFKMLQKLGWTEGEGLGADGSGIVNPVNKSSQRDSNHGLGIERVDDLEEGDDVFDAYRKRMMLAYRFRPNPLNNPRRPYY